MNNKDDGNIIVQLRNINKKYRNTKAKLLNRLYKVMDSKYYPIIDFIMNDDEQFVQHMNNDKFNCINDIIKEVNKQFDDNAKWEEFKEKFK